MKAIARNKLVLLLFSTLLLWGVVMAASWLFNVAYLPHEKDTSRNSYIIITAVHVASLLVFFRLKYRSTRHAHKQVVWLFVAFSFISLTLLLALRLEYSSIVLLMGLPCSIALLLRHQSDMAKNDEASLFTITGSEIETQLDTLGLTYISLPEDSLHQNSAKGLLLIPAQSPTHAFYRYLSGFDIPTNKRIVIAEYFIENYLGQMTSLPLEALAERAKTIHYYDPIKRLLEIIIAATLLIIVSPILLATYLLIKIVSPGPAIFTQERVGLDCAIFTIFKFRTMHLDSEAKGAQFATKGDPRIIRFGAFLRKSRIDELPQLWNVLRGDMSLIGPRPEQKDLFESLCQEIPQFALRQLTRPGITGWAQVVQGYADDEDSSRIKLSHDLYYIKHSGPTLDILIITRTLTTILTGFGSR